MDNTKINELNTVLKGEHMAIDGYEKYYQRIDDQYVKEELQKIQIDHKNDAIRIAKRIQDIGGEPADGVGFSGKMAELMSDVTDIGKTDTVLYLKDAYEGERKGIQMATEIVKGDLDEESHQIIKDILNDDRKHLETLDSLIKKVGNIE